MDGGSNRPPVCSCDATHGGLRCELDCRQVECPCNHPHGQLVREGHDVSLEDCLLHGWEASGHVNGDLRTTGAGGQRGEAGRRARVSVLDSRHGARACLSRNTPPLQTAAAPPSSEGAYHNGDEGGAGLGCSRPAQSGLEAADRSPHAPQLRRHPPRRAVTAAPRCDGGHGGPGHVLVCVRATGRRPPHLLRSPPLDPHAGTRGMGSAPT